MSDRFCRRIPEPLAPSRYQTAFETALAVAAYERIADKTGRCGWNQTLSAHRMAEPEGFHFPEDRTAIPVEFAEWAWPP